MTGKQRSDNIRHKKTAALNRENMGQSDGKSYIYIFTVLFRLNDWKSHLRESYVIKESVVLPDDPVMTFWLTITSQFYKLNICMEESRTTKSITYI